MGPIKNCLFSSKTHGSYNIFGSQREKLQDDGLEAVEQAGRALSVERTPATLSLKN